MYYTLLHIFSCAVKIFFQDVDECAVSTTCHADATCTNIIDGDLSISPLKGFKCECPVGWLGDGLPAPVGTGCSVLLKCPVGQYGIFAKSCKDLPQYGVCHPSLGLRKNIFESLEITEYRSFTGCRIFLVFSFKTYFKV